jgi:hypothetical protein
VLVAIIEGHRDCHGIDGCVLASRVECSGRAWISSAAGEPAPVKALQGRKSDRRDARRIAEYLQDGRLDASFVPPLEIRELRSLPHRVHLL